MRNKPAYGIESVDHALRLAVLLRQEGPLRVTDVAQRLGVARSTAHRLLAMLVYREFAVQDADRRYLAGPVLRHQTPEPVRRLRTLAVPHLRALVERTGETANLMILRGDQVRFAATVQCDQVLRVGDREGRLLPAHLASGGRALLACRGETEVTDLYTTPGAPEVDLPPTAARPAAGPPAGFRRQRSGHGARRDRDRPGGAWTGRGSGRRLLDRDADRALSTCPADGMGRCAQRDRGRYRA
jgi:hypothetical protein